MMIKAKLPPQCFVATGVQSGLSHIAQHAPRRRTNTCRYPVSTNVWRMSSPIVLCPGQGAQAERMGLQWAEASKAAARVIEKADEVYGSIFGGSKPGDRQWSISELLREGDKTLLDRTDIAQPAIYVVSIACWEGMKELGLVSDAKVVAGLSLGEYTALTIAEAFEFEEGLELVRLRGKAMQEAAEMSEGGMVALIGADEEKARRCVEAGQAKDLILVAANFNAPGQVVLSGSKAATEAAAEFAKTELKLRVAPLDVAGAFHSPLMAPAAEQLAAALKKVKISAPKIPVLSNVTAKLHTADDIRSKLVAQLTSSVMWASCVDFIRNDDTLCGPDQRWVELAPGKTLTGIVRKIDRKIKVENFDVPVVQEAGAR
eukprot:Plantae.Rhodophyta-Hildenbrandia_rubra.ctg2719.p1 GENE.Plantae.Rhodophyta-Hildenbrandia_rubra.ctg2719~~Plantae.Rhodophyta-Hildenbrandia_rubra.ctg2719.p1  ORF type:complete len:373 (-),score=68.08 Plantae.Rhodophyta-Hildenbrandia_rubra.ctg2719:445-1563(-)